MKQIKTYIEEYNRLREERDDLLADTNSLDTDSRGYELIMKRIDEVDGLIKKLCNTKVIEQDAIQPEVKPLNG